MYKYAVNLTQHHTTYPHVRSDISFNANQHDGRENYLKMIITQFPVKSFIIKIDKEAKNNDFIIIIIIINYETLGK